MPPEDLSEQPQYPVNANGVKAPNSFIGSHQVFFQGSTGLVATSYGTRGFTVGRLRTGVYGIKFPPVKHIQFLPGIQAPSGLGYQVAIKGMSGATQVIGVSGYAEVHITRTEQAPVVTGTTPSTMIQHQTPATGTVLDLVYYASTVHPLGY
mgnify:FL=1